MSFFEALLLGVVQGLTEFIPVSSSGHLLLMHEVLGTGENSLGFDVALHVGTLVALLVYFRADIWSLAESAFSRTKEGAFARLILYATLPAAIMGFLLSNWIDEYVRSPATVAVALAVVGFVMLVVERYAKKRTETVTTPTGLKIGVAQALALIPGVSRSGATITAGLLLGLTYEAAARFSFLLAIPIVAGSAFGLLLEGDALGGEATGVLVVGITAAFASGLLAIRFMLRSIARFGLRPFAFYRIALAVIVLLILV